VSPALDDITVESIITLGPTTGGKLLTSSPSVSIDDFDSAVATISLAKKDHASLIVGGDERIRQLEFRFEDIQALSARLIDWARQQDVDAALKKLRELPTDAKGRMPRLHLVALALAGDTDRLRFYQESF